MAVAPERTDPPPYQQPPPQQEQEKSQVVHGPYPVVANVKFNDRPTLVHCPHCNNDVTSVISYRIGLLTLLIMGIIYVIGVQSQLFLLFAVFLIPVPLCIKSFKDVDHTCPVCQYHLGKYERGK